MPNLVWSDSPLPNLVWLGPAIARDCYRCAPSGKREEEGAEADPLHCEPTWEIAGDTRGYPFLQNSLIRIP